MFFRIAFVFLFLFAVISCSNASTTDRQPAIQKGISRLTHQQLKTGSPVKLSGEWLFAWKEFVTNFDSLSLHRTITVPGSWRKYTRTSFLEKEVGYCTYGARIYLPEAKMALSLHLPPIHSAYRLYINGRLYSEVGKVAGSDKMVPAVAAQVVNFTCDSNIATIVIHVSNFNFSSGGIWTPISLGTAKTIVQKREWNLFVSSFLIGSLMIMGFYHLSLYIIRRKDMSPLYFSLICFFIALRESFGGEAVFYNIFPAVGYELSTKILYLAFPVALLAFIQYFGTLYLTYNLWMKRLAAGVSLVYLLLIVFTNNTVYGKYLVFVSVIFIIQSVYWVFLIIAKAKNAVTDNLLVLGGILVLVFAFFNDILFEVGAINSYFMLPFGFFVFILFQSILLSMRFSRAFHQSEMLEVELMKSNLAYQEIMLKQRQAEERKAVEEMKSRFFSNITHEFRTPLSLIISPIEKILQGNWEKSELKRAVTTIHRSAVHLLQLINQLLDLSKLEANKMELTKSRGDVVSFLNEIVCSFDLRAAENNIILTCDCRTPHEDLIFDGEKLEKIMFNLLSNALKFTGEGGKVSVEAFMEHEMLHLVVRDTGIGVPATQLEYIFDRFYQVDNSITRPFGGTGIGLALVKELIDLVGGSIKVESDPNVGTTFFIQFPTSKPIPIIDDSLQSPAISLIQMPTALSAPTMAIPSLEGVPSILLVEDNKELLEYISYELSQKYLVITATDGEEAWQVCERELPDLIISDVMMPKMDGFDLCKKVKETDLTNHIGVILLTAKGSIESKVSGLSSGANDYLSKPFNQQELELRVNNFFRYKENLQRYYSTRLSTLSRSGGEVKGEEINPFLIKIYDAIDRSIDNSDLCVDDIASEMAMSSRTLNRKLSSIIGLSANEVIKNYRLRKATELLRAGNNISEVAYCVGFDSPSYFGRCFKELYNITPSEFLVN